jgi:hypothetical protein
MKIADAPLKFPIPFANNAAVGTIRPIPTAHQAVVPGVDAPASLYDGWPIETMTDPGAGGIPPAGRDANGLENQVTANIRFWSNAGVPAQYDSAFSSAIGGYPKYTILASTTIGTIWQSAVDDNTTDPDAGGAGWYTIQQGLEKVGQERFTLGQDGVYTVTFPTPFPNNCTNVQLTGVNSTAGDHRDNWPQLVSRTRFGFTFQNQSAADTGSYTLDGIDWLAKGN